MILVVNSGSSNVKFAVYDAETLTPQYRAQVNNLQEMLTWLAANATKYKISAIGHRIVHGGRNFFEPVVVTSDILTQLKQFIPLAPLHQPYNIAAIEILAKQYPKIPQIACFDTAFHTTQMRLAKMFAIPNDLTESGVIRYGFHGLSYEYIASVLDQYLGDLSQHKIIVAHLGNGASICAMQQRKSLATSMGFSALDGLVMGTRCGNIDPGVLLYLLQEKNYTATEVADLLYNKSGLLGVSNISNDMQQLLASKDPQAQLAVDLFCYRAAGEIGRLMVTLKGCDAIVFTAGIGEHAPIVRQKICDWLSYLGNIKVVVIPTNEEIIIAQHVKKLNFF